MNEKSIRALGVALTSLVKCQTKQLKTYRKAVADLAQYDAELNVRGTTGWLTPEEKDFDHEKLKQSIASAEFAFDQTTLQIQDVHAAFKAVTA